MNAPGTPLYSGPAGPVHEQIKPIVIGALDAAPAGDPTALSVPVKPTTAANSGQESRSP